MVALTSEEWAIVIVLGLLGFGILYARAMKKHKTKRKRDNITKKVYDSAIRAQSEAIEGVKNTQGASIHERSMPLDLQDPTRMYVRSTLAEVSHRDYLMENEFLSIH
jgi:hypothetical protein